MALNGVWINELGSVLALKEGPEGRLEGSYETAVGTCAKGKFPVSGRTDVFAGGETLGFAVAWKNDQSACNSTTTWVGHCRSAGEEGESLVTFWVMAEKTGPDEEWESTTLGSDTFYRKIEAASEEQSAEAPPQRPANP
jgi:hypothetical protein